MHGLIYLGCAVPIQYRVRVAEFLNPDLGKVRESMVLVLGEEIECEKFQAHTRQTVVCHHAYVCLSLLMVICQSRPHYKFSENQTSACKPK